MVNLLLLCSDSIYKPLMVAMVIGIALTTRVLYPYLTFK